MYDKINKAIRCVSSLMYEKIVSYRRRQIFMELNSQRVRALAPENDPLKIGMGWTVEDLDKPQILVESTFGDSHPGSAHLNQF